MTDKSMQTYCIEKPMYCIETPFWKQYFTAAGVIGSDGAVLRAADYLVGHSSDGRFLNYVDINVGLVDTDEMISTLKYPERITDFIHGMGIPGLFSLHAKDILCDLVKDDVDFIPCKVHFFNDDVEDHWLYKFKTYYTDKYVDLTDKHIGIEAEFTGEIVVSQDFFDICQENELKISFEPYELAYKEWKRLEDAAAALLKK